MRNYSFLFRVLRGERESYQLAKDEMEKWKEKGGEKLGSSSFNRRGDDTTYARYPMLLGCKLDARGHESVEN